MSRSWVLCLLPDLDKQIILPNLRQAQINLRSSKFTKFSAPLASRPRCAACRTKSGLVLMEIIFSFRSNLEFIFSTVVPYRYKLGSMHRTFFQRDFLRIQK